MAQPARQLPDEPATQRPTAQVIPTRQSQISRADLRSPSYQAYQLLHVGFTVAPILAGADKFFHFLTNWDAYLAPFIPRLLGVSGHTFMLAVGVIEVVAGIGVAVRPRIFGYVVSAWLIGIIINLLLTGHYFDIALRDLGLSLGALALARLAEGLRRKAA